MSKNILHVFSGDYRMGNGIFTVLDTLLNKIDSKKINCTLFVPSQKKKDFNYKVVYGNNFLFKSLLTENEFDLVIFHGIYFLDYFYKSLLCFRKRVPYLFKPHGGLVKAGLKKSKIKKKLFFVFGFNFLLNKSTGIIFINLEERNKSLNFRTNSYIETNLIPLNFNSRKIKSNKVRFLFFSRIDFYTKGLDVLLKGIREIPEEFRSKMCVNFYGVGDKSEIDRLKNYINKYNLSFISYKGPIKSDSDRNWMYSNSDILLLTSRHEGYPTVITEALTFGVPPVVTPGTNSCFLSQNGIGWSTKLDSHSVAKAIKIAFIDFKENEDEIIVKTKSFAQRNFKVEEDIKEIEEFYSRLIAQL